MATINGTAGNDTKTGTAGADIVNLFGGNDSATGGNGTDTLYGGNGNDRIDGGAGNDRVEGGNGNDYLLGSTGNDRIYGQDGNDTAYGGEGTDALNGDNGNDTAYGGNLNDSLTGGGGVDTLYGDAGDDKVNAGADADTVYGGNGNDSILGDLGSDRLEGGAGNDTLTGDAGDTLIGGLGNDSLVGGRILSWADGSAGGVTIDLRFGTAKRGAEVDRIAGNQEVVIGGSSGDRIIANNKVLGVYDDGAEIDRLDYTIYGGSGSDQLFDSYGEDRLFGGNGDDVIRSVGVSERDSIQSDIADGGAGNDTIIIAYESSAIGGDGDDYLEINGMYSYGGGGNGNDMIVLNADGFANGGAGQDYIIGAALQALGGADDDSVLVNGDAYGEAGDDYLKASGFAYGGNGNDIIEGTWTFAGVGSARSGNTLVGGAGADTFIIKYSEEAETEESAPFIADFQKAQGDIIDLREVDAILDDEVDGSGNPISPGDSTFNWIGVSSDPGVGQIGYYYLDGNTVIRGVMGGDHSVYPSAKVTLILSGVVAPDATWFLL